MRPSIEGDIARLRKEVDRSGGDAKAAKDEARQAEEGWTAAAAAEAAGAAADVTAAESRAEALQGELAVAKTAAELAREKNALRQLLSTSDSVDFAGLGELAAEETLKASLGNNNGRTW